MTAMDLILVILIGGFLLGRGSQTHECHESLFWAGIGFLMYGFFFVLRNVIVLLSVYWTRKPKVNSLIGRFIGVFIDWIALTVLAVHATQVIRDDQSMMCKEESEPIAQWYMITAVCIIATYCYLALLWFLMPAILIFVSVTAIVFRNQRNAAFR